MPDYVLVEKSEGVALLTLNRPEQLNAMNRQLSAELHDAVTRAEGVRVSFVAIVILYSALGVATLLALRALSRRWAIEDTRGGGARADDADTVPYGPRDGGP